MDFLMPEEAFKKLLPNPNNPAVDHNSTTVPNPALAPIVIPPAPSSTPKSRHKPKTKAPIQPEPESIAGYKSSASNTLSASESNLPVDAEAQDQAANEVKTSDQSAAKKGKSNANGNTKEAARVGENGKAGGGSGEKASGGASKGGGKGSANGGPSAGCNEDADAGAGGSRGKGKGKAKAQAVPAKEAVPNPGIRRSTREVLKKVGQ
ncbi:hypothetical protein FRC10_002153 [Ceratobasidium sp. 414]|nr:hypothetical protein FRC10_002153 [Ceratobasidium sp. 414]